MEKSPEAFRTIGEVAEDIDVPQHVLRFWEGKFSQVKPMKRAAGGRRYYRANDLELLRGIRHLLYGEGYTIKGVQRIFREHGVEYVAKAGRRNVPPRQTDASSKVSSSAETSTESVAEAGPERADLHALSDVLKELGEIKTMLTGKSRRRNVRVGRDRRGRSGKRA